MSTPIEKRLRPDGPRVIEFFFDVASPYTYLATEVIDAEAARAGVSVVWRPFLLGAVLKATGNPPPAGVAAKALYLLADLHRWAGRYGVPFRMSSRFPLTTVLPQRVLTAASPERRPALTQAVMRAVWTEDRDVADPAVLRDVLGAEGEPLLAAAQTQEIKDALRASTEEAVRRGAFGAPTFFVGPTLFWGNDRIDFAIEEARR